MAAAFASLVVFGILALSSTDVDCRQVPKYEINLDLPPEQRFSQICKDYGQYLTKFQNVIAHLVPAKFIPLFEKIIASLDVYFPQPFADEIRGMSKQCNVTLGELVMLNLFYESTAYCTSIIVQDSNGKILHGRNFDYDYLNLLRNVTFVADFVSEGTVLYSGVMFAGYMGIATGQKNHAFTISIDERDQGYWWENAFEALFNKKARIIGFLAREVLSSKNINFQQAVGILTNVSLIAPAYFIVGGVNPTDGVVITHNREKADDVWYLGSGKQSWYLVETNYDHWTTPPPDDDRRHPAEKALNSTGQTNISPDTLAKVLSVHPVLNKATVYTSVMSAADPGLFYTYFPEMGYFP